MGNKARRSWSKAYEPTRAPDEPRKAEKLRPWVAPAAEARGGEAEAIDPGLHGSGQPGASVMSDIQVTPEAKPRAPAGNARGKRVSTYSEKTAKLIIGHVLDGKSVRKIVTMEGMPAIETFYKWLKKNDDFRQRYAEAKFIQVANRFDEVIDLADDKDLELDLKREMIKARQWLVGRLLPGTFQHPYMSLEAPRLTNGEFAKLVNGEEPAAPAQTEPEVTVIENDPLADAMTDWRREKGR